LEELDADNPPVDHCTWLNVWIVEHSFNVTHVYFHPNILDTNDVKPVSLEGNPETINLDFSLRII